ncbi:MAG: serine/threonine-protein kinase, partial [Phycicoccus sp.]
MNSEQRRLAGRYVLESPIGHGGMGQVWRATDTVLGRAVAVKTIDLHRIPDQAGAERFEREARVTASLNHPNVVTVHDSGVEGDTAFLVMELLPGPSLAERMTEGPLPVAEVIEVGRQVASALDAAHGRGLVHRDIKPGNVAYADDGRVRVLDFGITQLGESTGAPALTATHTVMGTAEYLAPEQATGGRVDGRADLYALGCLLYALLAGRAPFSGPTPVATMVMHTHDPVPDLLEARPDTPMWLADLVDALLAKSPVDRPAGAAVVAAALEEHRAPAAAATTTLLPAAGAPATQRMAPAPAPVSGPAPTGPPTLPPDTDERDR